MGLWEVERVAAEEGREEEGKEVEKEEEEREGREGVRAKGRGGWTGVGGPRGRGAGRGEGRRGGRAHVGAEDTSCGPTPAGLAITTLTHTLPILLLRFG